MSQVLVLGAGMVAKPLVHYLLERNYHVTVGDLNLEQAQKLVEGHAKGQAIMVNASEPDTWLPHIKSAHLVVSLLPPPFHPQIAQACLENKKHFASASYLSDAMSQLDGPAKEADLVFLNEMGLDPGLDHATAMELIDQARDQGYSIESFTSHCGGIPSRKAANNPLRYKFSWSPRGVLGALTRPSRFKRDDQLMEIPGNEKLEHAQVINIPGGGIFESNPNADSLYYGDRYGLSQTHTVYRGTLRYPGWSQFWLYMLELGFIDQERTANFDKTPVMQALLQLAGKDPNTDILSYVRKDRKAQASVFLEAMERLGLLDPENVISGTYSAFEIILDAALKTMQYSEDEADLVVLHHEFIVSKDGKKELWTSTLVQEGKPQEDTTAMAITVGVPLGITARLILENQITQRGVLIPIDRNIYRPLLDELTSMGLHHKIIKRPL